MRATYWDEKTFLTGDTIMEAFAEELKSRISSYLNNPNSDRRTDAQKALKDLAVGSPFAAIRFNKTVLNKVLPVAF
jgi:hypothetical protein